MWHRLVISLASIAPGLAVFAWALPASADHAPVIVIPSRPGIPVVINGRDASYAVVEGDWGLSRPGHGVITVIGGSPLSPNPIYTPRDSYHPRYGIAPPRGRNEVEPSPDRALPDPPESFSRSWSTSSDVPPARRQGRPSAPPTGDDVPPTITDPETFPRDFEAPEVVVPRRRRR